MRLLADAMDGDPVSGPASGTRARDTEFERRRKGNRGKIGRRENNHPQKSLASCSLLLSARRIWERYCLNAPQSVVRDMHMGQKAAPEKILAVCR